MKASSWKQHEKVAAHYIALGQKEVWLSDYDGVKEFPWEHVTRCEPGGSHRLDISTDITFYATGPSGLTYRWHFDIEPRDANGSGHYQIAVQAIKGLIAKLPPKAIGSLKAYFAECAVAVRKRADEYQQTADQQFSQAAQLENLSK